MIVALIFGIFIPVLACLAQTNVEVPEEVSNVLGKTVENFISGTFVLSTGFVAAVQIIKKVMEKFNVEVAGVKSKVLAVLIAIVYAVVSTGVWEDGSLTNQDIVILIQAGIAAFSGVFGYKLLWKQPSASITAPTADVETKETK